METKKGNRPTSERQMEDLSWVLGLNIQVETIFDDTYTGSVYAFCPITHTITLQDGRTNFRILKVGFLRDLTVLDRPKSAGKGELGAHASTEPAIRPVNLSNLKATQSGRLGTGSNGLPQRGLGVSKEAQTLFDALSRTLPCRWVDKSIIVLDVVRVDEPYIADSCRAPAGQANALERVRKVLDGERRRLSLKAEERKGG